VNSKDTTTWGRVVDHVRGIPPGVWALGFVSMLIDVSSAMIHALLPVCLVTDRCAVLHRPFIPIE
jgi:hypothetical protein